jgi:hypothetical protein
MRDKQKNPTLRVRDIVAKLPKGDVQFISKAYDPKRVKEFREAQLDLRATHKAAPAETKAEIEKLLSKGVPTSTGVRKVTTDERAFLKRQLAAATKNRNPFAVAIGNTNPYRETSEILETDTPVANAGVSERGHPFVGKQPETAGTTFYERVAIREAEKKDRANLTPKVKPAPKKVDPAPLVQQILSRLAEANIRKETSQFEQLKGRAIRWNKKLRMPGLRVANTVNFIEVLAKRGDVARLQQIIDGTLQGASIGETVWVNPFISNDAQFEILAHEMGHVLAHNTAPENHQQVFKAWQTWREANKKGKLKDAAAARRTISLAIKQFGAIAEHELDAMSASEVGYVLDFEEWFADQVAETLISEVKATGSTARWFTRFANKITTLHNAAKADETAVAPEVRQFIDRVIHTDVQATIRVRRGMKKDVRSAAAIVGANPTTQYANKAVMAMLETEWITGKPLNALLNAFKTNSVINRRIQDRIRPFSPATAELVRTDPNTAVAYGYQLWSMGELELGPASLSAFERLNDNIFKMLGEVSDMKQAQQISEQVREQVMRMQRQNPNADFDQMVRDIRAYRGGAHGATNGFVLNQVMKKTLVQKAAQRMKESWLKYAHQLFKRVFQPAYDRLAAVNNAAITELIRRIWVPPGVQGRDEGLLQARPAETARWQDRFARALGKGVSPELAAELLDAMYQNKPAASVEAQNAAVEVRKVFSDIFDYATQGGIKLGQGKRENYFPWVYDMEQLAERKDEWIAMMTAPAHNNTMRHILQQMNEEGVGSRKKGTWRSYAEIYGLNNITDLADYYHSQLVNDEGYADTAVARRVKSEKEKRHLRVDKTGHVPFVAAMNERGLNFLQAVDDSALKDMHQSFLSKDLNQVLRVYTEQLVKRVEFNRRFKINSHTGATEVEELMAEAKKLGATPHELRLAQDFVDAAQGTIGIRLNSMITKALTGEAPPEGQVINPKLQTTFSALILWQNVRTLALAGFTSLADPAGILVRGGALDTAFASLKAGFSIKNTDMHSTKVAEGLGIIDTYSIDQALASTYGTNFMTGRTRLWNEKFFTLTGLQFITRVTRAAATGGALQLQALP